MVPQHVLPTHQTSRAAQVGASPGLPHPPVLATLTELPQEGSAQLWPGGPLITERSLPGAKGSLPLQLKTLTQRISDPSVTSTCILTVPPDRHIAQGGHSTGASRLYCCLCADLHLTQGFTTDEPGGQLSVQGQSSCSHPTPPNSTWAHSPRCTHTHREVYNTCSCMNKYSCTTQGGTEPDAVLGWVSAFAEVYTALAAP